MKWKNKTRINGKKSKLYVKWLSMKDRCYNKNNNSYHNYGGRGIFIDDIWLNNYDNFHDWCINNGYSEALDLDRIDNNMGYSPNNCRFVNRSINNKNRRPYGDIKIKGVRLRGNKYQALIYIDGKQKYIGTYDTIEEANTAYNNYFK